MSQLTSKSRALLGAFLLLLFLQLLPSEQGAELESRSLAPVVEEGLQRIAIGRLGQERVLLERGEEGWSLAAPLEGPADPRLIEALLRPFEEGLELGARLESGSLERYALDDQNSVRLEFFREGDEDPVLSLQIGGEVPGRVNFVRLSDEELVYRARIGGRDRYSLAPEQWLNRQILSRDARELLAIQIQRPEARLTFRRDDADAPWSLAEESDFPLDQRGLTALSRQLATLQASALRSSAYEGGFDQPLVKLQLRWADESEDVLLLGGRSSAKAAWIQHEDQVFELDGVWTRRLTRSLEGYGDLQIWRVSASQFQSLQLESRGKETIELARAAGGGLRVLRPQGLDLSEGPLRKALQTLTDFRADRRLAALPEGQESPEWTERLILRSQDGQELVLELGPLLEAAEGRRLARRGDGQLFLLRPQTYELLMAGLGR